MSIIILAVIISIMLISLIVLLVVDLVHLRRTKAFNDKYNTIISNLNYLRQTNGSDEEIAHFEKEFINLFN